MIKKITLLMCFLCISLIHIQAQKKLTLQDIYERRVFSENSVYGVNWTKNGKYYSSIEDNNIVKYDVTTGNAVETILQGSTLSPQIAIDDYAFSADEKKILLTTEFESIYRRSFKAQYYVYDLTAKTLKKLTEGDKQSYATFSPDGSKVAFVRDNNLFFTNLANMETKQVTQNGEFNKIINGSADWVYEEEFAFAQAFFWSPDGTKIAFYTFDESAVKEYNMQVWNAKQLYPIDYRFKYPKAGEANSIITISVYDLAQNSIKPMDIGTEKDIYIPRINWTKNSNLLSIRRMNRLQNKLEILHADVQIGKTTTVFNEENNTYIDMEYTDNLVYLKDGNHFIFASESDGYKHFYLYTLDGKLVRQITKGNWEVDSFLGIDETTKPATIYYTSTEDSPLERQFYTIDIEGKKKTKLSLEKGTNEINMSPDFSYYLVYNSSIDNPTKVSLFQTKGNQLIKVLEDNATLKGKTQEYNFIKKELFDFKTSDNTTLYGYMFKPANFDANKKYPLLMYVYGGPGSQEVKNNWINGHLYWFQYLAQQGYVIACVDNRGTTARGASFKKSTYAQLGKYEVQDQIEAAKYLGSLSFIDKNRIGIWGWSYGGYMTALCMTVGADVFKIGISVAPVTTWRLYDTVYTERFLKRPQDNPSGYDDNSPITHAHKLKGAYLLIHGTGDDNVHFQNAVLWQDALIKAGKQFSSFYYPNRNHGIYGGNTRLHLYQMMTNFVVNNL